MGRFSNLEWGGPAKKGAAGSAAQRRLEEELEGPAGGEPRDEAFYLKRADEHYRGGRFEKALRYYSRALEFDPNSLAGWVGQVRMLLELGELDEARVWADKGLDVHRDAPDLLAAKAQVCARSGDPEKALAFCDGAMKGKGASSFVWLARGEALVAARRGDPDHCLSKAVTEAKGDWFLSALAARISLLHGQAPRALAYAERAVARDAKQALAWATLGEVRAALGIGAEAERAFEHALALDPESAGASDGLERVQRLGPIGRLWRRIKAALDGRGGKKGGRGS